MRSNCDGRARSADCALACDCSADVDVRAVLCAAVDAAGKDVMVDVLDRGDLPVVRSELRASCAVVARGGGMVVADSVWLFTLPRDDSCGLTGVPPSHVGLPSRVAVCSVLELLLEAVAEIDDSSLCSAGSYTPSLRVRWRRKFDCGLVPAADLSAVAAGLPSR
jgi:hypothetical protein